MELDTVLVIYFSRHRYLLIPFPISTFMYLLTLPTGLSGKWECLLY